MAFSNSLNNLHDPFENCRNPGHDASGLDLRGADPGVQSYHCWVAQSLVVHGVDRVTV